HEAARLWPRQVLERLWRAEPAATALALTSLLSLRGAPRAAQRARAKRAGALLQSQPARSELSVLSDVERALSECEGDDQLLAPLLQYLALRVKRRAPDWRQAYTLLDQAAARRARTEPSQRR
ncbi:MAG: hypothetical protein KIT72_19970, partial [Polyangiaceae bacterium]|nr:hypothetical protein [Polyangiaceae bacterium]